MNLFGSREGFEPPAFWSVAALKGGMQAFLVLSDAVKRQNPAIPWRIIKDTRNFYVHSYGAIDVRAVWDTLEQDIPALKAACETILSA